MWREGLLYRIDGSVIASSLCVAMIAAAWGGYRLAHLSMAHLSKEERETRLEALSELGPMEGAIAGLLALVLAFSFNLAAQRFDKRQSFVISHASATETAYLRCSLLDPGDRTYCEDQLRSYVDLYVAYGAASRDPEEIEAIVRKADAIEQALWARVAAVTRERPTHANVAEVEAINEVIDRRTDRIASNRILVPEMVTVVMLALCVTWAAIGGYSYGLKHNEKKAAWVVFSVLVAIVVYVTIDFDRPRRGPLRLDAGNQSMIDLRDELQLRGAP
jgi:hypothetical protein